MRITDRRLYQAANLEDFAFRYNYRDGDNAVSRIATREVNGLLSHHGIVAFIAPDTNKIFGGDFSDWDGNVNIQVFRDFGAKFVIIKAIDGTVPSKYWRANNQRAIEAGLMNGAYGWLYPDNRVPCVLQARAYADLLATAWTQMPPTIDFEWTRYAGLQANPNYTDLRKWVTEFIRVTGKKPILYSAAGYMNMFGAMPLDLRDMFSGFWWASYGGLSVPRGFTTDYDIWQFTSNGDALALAPGDTNKRELDLNYMSEAFYSRLGGTVITDPVLPPQEGTDMQGTVRANKALVIRDATGADTGKRLAAGDVVYGAVTGGRIYFHRVYRLGVTVEQTPGNAATVNPVNPADSYMILADVAEPVTPTPEPTDPPDVIEAKWLDKVTGAVVKVVRYLPE